jgi:preprotein translocase subunit SecA
MLSSRVKGQLAGRAGRQGDPGTSQFYVSLEDRYISHASTGRLKKYYRKLMRKKKNGADIVQLSGIPLKVGLKMLRERVEVKGVMSRMQTNKYEVVLRMQRDHFYQQRKKIMYLNDLQDNINQYLKAGINNYLSQRKNWTQAELRYLINEHFSYDYIKDLPTISSKKEIEKFLFELSQKILQDKAQILINREQLNEFFRQVILSAMDACWVDQMDYLSNLKLYVDKWNLAGYESDYVYQQRAYEAFEKMQKNIQNSIVDKLLLSPIHLTKEKKLVVVFN